MAHMHLKLYYVGLMNTKTVESSNSQMHHNQQELQEAESNYYLLGKEESSEYIITEINDDYADPDEGGEGWDQEENVYHMLEGPAIEGEGPTQDDAMPVPSEPPKNN